MFLQQYLKSDTSCFSHLATLAAYRLPALHSWGFHHPEPIQGWIKLSKFTFQRVTLVIHHTDVPQEWEALAQVSKRRHLLVHNNIDASIPLLVEGDEVKRERNFWVERVVACLNVWEQSSAKPESLKWYRLDYLLTFPPEEVWGPARSARPTKLEPLGDILQSREGRVKVSQVCRKAANLAGQCNTKS